MKTQNCLFAGLAEAGKEGPGKVIMERGCQTTNDKKTLHLQFLFLSPHLSSHLVGILELHTRRKGS